MPVRRVPVSVAALLAGALLAAGCGHIDTTGVCIGLCGPATLQKAFWAVGFPQGRVDHTATGASGYYHGVLPVGQSVTLYQIYTEFPGFGGDTTRAVTWRLSDTTAARVESLPDGGARITGKAAGTMGQLTGNGTAMVIWSCPPSPAWCERLDGIQITP